MDENYWKNCTAVEGTVSSVLGDNAGFLFESDKMTTKDGKVAELTPRKRLFYASAPVLDNEPVYAGDRVRIDKKFISFPKNLTRYTYLPFVEVLRGIEPEKLLCPEAEVEVTAKVDKIYVGWSDNVWLRLEVTALALKSPSQLLQNLPSKRFFLCLNDMTSRLFNNMSEKRLNEAKIAFSEVAAGDKIRLVLSEFEADKEDTERMLRCNRLTLLKASGCHWLKPMAAMQDYIDVDDLWPENF